jgi:hypothetical protein
VDFDRTSAAVIVIGSALFLAAAFSPISRVFGIRDSAERLEVISSAPNQWLFAQALFALGAVVTAVGVALLAIALAGESFAGRLHASAALMGIGSLLWTIHVYMRAVDPARFTAGGIPLWLYAGYALATIVALTLLGLALLQTVLPPWVGWLNVGGAALFLLLALVFGDLPPLLFYLVTLTVGIVVYRAATATAAVIHPIA